MDTLQHQHAGNLSKSNTNQNTRRTKMRKALYILAELDDQDLVWLAAAGQAQTIPAKTVLIEKHKAIETLYIVIEGQLEVRLSKFKKVADLASGDIIGEMSLIEKQPPSVSVITTSETKLLAIPLSAIKQRLKTDLGFAARFYHAIAIFLSDRLRSTVSQLGYGKETAKNTQQQIETEQELDEGILDTLHIAGDRMIRLIALLEGKAS